LEGEGIDNDAVDHSLVSIDDGVLEGNYDAMDIADGSFAQAPSWWQQPQKALPGSGCGEQRAPHLLSAADSIMLSWPLMAGGTPLLVPERGCLLSTRHSMPSCRPLLGIDAKMGAAEQGMGLSRAMSVPEASLHLRNTAPMLSEPIMDARLSSELESMDMHLQMSDDNKHMDALLLGAEPAQDSIIASNDMPLLGSSRLGSSEYESARPDGGMGPSAAVYCAPESVDGLPDVGYVEHFFCTDEDAQEDKPCAPGRRSALSSGGGSTESLASDGSVIYLHGLPGLPSAAKGTPQVRHAPCTLISCSAQQSAWRSFSGCCSVMAASPVHAAGSTR
jgi:hypothetical protein